MVRRRVDVEGSCEAVLSVIFAAASKRICWAWSRPSTENKLHMLSNAVYHQNYHEKRSKSYASSPALVFIFDRTFRQLISVGSGAWLWSFVAFKIWSLEKSVVIFALQLSLFRHIQYTLVSVLRLAVYENPWKSSISPPLSVWMISMATAKIDGKPNVL